jgi:hypothetical protein
MKSRPNTRFYRQVVYTASNCLQRTHPVSGIGITTDRLHSTTWAPYAVDVPAGGFNFTLYCATNRSYRVTRADAWRSVVETDLYLRLSDGIAVDFLIADTTGRIANGRRRQEH